MRKQQESLLMKLCATDYCRWQLRRLKMENFLFLFLVPGSLLLAPCSLSTGTYVVVSGQRVVSQWSVFRGERCELHWAMHYSTTPFPLDDWMMGRRTTGLLARIVSSRRCHLPRL
jgi:hypothetical protein